MLKHLAASALLLMPAVAGARDVREVAASPGSFVVYTDLATLRDGRVQTWTGNFSRDITGNRLSYSGITVAVDCAGNRWRATEYQLFDASGATVKTQEATKDWQVSQEGSTRSLVDIVCHREQTPAPRLGDVDPIARITAYFARDMAN